MPVNQNPLKEIIDNDLCTWCWICADFEKSPYTINLDKFWKLKAFYNSDSKISQQLSSNLSECCPFSNDSLNEDEISEKIFNEVPNKDKFVWKYYSFYAWHVSEWSFREKWSSGWLWTWILKEMLSINKVDKVIHVQWTDNEVLFEYSVSDSVENLRKWAKSKYYPITLFWMLSYIQKNDYNYMVVWIPCFLKALRLYSEKNSIIKSRVKFTLWLVCWHLKSQKFWEMLAWQVGVKKWDIKAIDFREKNLNKSADSYNFSATNKKWEKYEKNMKELFWWNWGANFFKYKACDYCDDTFAEVADVMIWDAWIPPYSKESLWNNILITRNKEIEEVVLKWIQENRLKLDTISYEQIIASQKAWINHKNTWLAYRLKYTKEKIEKRVTPSNKDVTLFYKCIFRLRVILRDYSHMFYLYAEKMWSFWIFKILISPILLLYYGLYFFVFIKKKFKKW